ncbi:hypothetical protein [Haemophilus sp. SZY H56]
MHKGKEKIWREKFGLGLVWRGVGRFCGQIYAKNENGEKGCKMVENWVLFCIKMNGGFVVFKPF